MKLVPACGELKGGEARSTRPFGKSTVKKSPLKGPLIRKSVPSALPAAPAKGRST
jgi:hypothetical protein